MFLEELIKLATDTSLLVVILLAVGVIFCFIEAIVPGFGFFGITGILTVIAGIIVHAFVSGSAIQVLFIIIIIGLISVLLILIFLKSAKYGLLSKISFVENKTALPIDYANHSGFEAEALTGKKGVTVTECRPIGKIEVDGKVFDATAKEFLANNIEVLITHVEGNSIYIEKVIKGEK